MITVGVRDLKNQLSQYLQYVKRGEKIIITEHNRVIAEISSPSNEVSNKKGTTIPPRSLRRLDPFGASAPSFTARDCSQDSTTLSSARFLLLRYSPSASPVLSRKKTKITCLSPSLGHSSHTLPTLLSVAPVGLAPRTLAPPFGTLFLFPGIYRHRRRSSNTGRFPSCRHLLSFTSSAARPCAASPSFGPSARRPSWPRAPGSSLRAFTDSVQGHLKCVFMAPLFKTATWPAHRRISGKPKARNLRRGQPSRFFSVM